MRVSRIFVDQTLCDSSDMVLDDRAARYVSQVLRLRAGQQLTLFNGDGRDFAAEITACSRRHCSVHVGSVIATERQTALQVHLGIGVSRGERMDYAIQKSVELGVTAISPLLTVRSLVQLTPERAAHRLAHWQGVIVSACEQSGRNRLPSLHPLSTLTDWVHENPAGLMLHHAASTTLATLPKPRGPVNLLIGPEGGLDESERALATGRGFTGVRMGPRVMRTETAPLAALAAMQALWGDFR